MNSLFSAAAGVDDEDDDEAAAAVLLVGCLACVVDADGCVSVADEVAPVAEANFAASIRCKRLSASGVELRARLFLQNLIAES